jgi:hypothetical protein
MIYFINDIISFTHITGMEKLEVLYLRGNNFDNATGILSCLEGFHLLSLYCYQGACVSMPIILLTVRPDMALILS